MWLAIHLISFELFLASTWAAVAAEAAREGQAGITAANEEREMEEGEEEARERAR